MGFLAGTIVGPVSGYMAVPAICAESIDQFILNRDFGIIEDDDDNTLINEIRKRNPNMKSFDGLHFHNKNNISAIVKADKSSRYYTDSSVEIKYMTQRNLHDTSYLLNDWQNHYHKFLNELKRQAQEDVPRFTLEQQRTWQDDKNHKIRQLLIDLKQNIEIIRMDNLIKKLYQRVLTLENDLRKLEETVEKMQTELNCAGISKKLDSVSSGASTFNKLSKSVPMIINAIPASAQVVPVVGQVFAGLSTLNSVYCFLQKQHLVE